MGSGIDPRRAARAVDFLPTEQQEAGLAALERNVGVLCVGEGVMKARATSVTSSWANEVVGFSTTF